MRWYIYQETIPVCELGRKRKYEAVEEGSFFVWSATYPFLNTHPRYVCILNHSDPTIPLFPSLSFPRRLFSRFLLHRLLFVSFLIIFLPFSRALFNICFLLFRVVFFSLEIGSAVSLQFVILPFVFVFRGFYIA